MFKDFVFEVYLFFLCTSFFTGAIAWLLSKKAKSFESFDRYADVYLTSFAMTGFFLLLGCAVTLFSLI